HDGRSQPRAYGGSRGSGSPLPAAWPRYPAPAVGCSLARRGRPARLRRGRQEQLGEPHQMSAMVAVGISHVAEPTLTSSAEVASVMRLTPAVLSNRRDHVPGKITVQSGA